MSRAGRLEISAFIAIFTATALLSLALAMWTNQREVSMIILFIPLIWSYLTLRLRWMVLSVFLVSMLRVLAEAIVLKDTSGGSVLLSALSEAVWPIALYVTLCVVFYLYRRRQAVLTAAVVEARAQELRDHVVRSLAHDFNNLLTVIVGTADLLTRIRPVDASLKRDLEAISRAGQQCQKLVQRIRRVHCPEMHRPEQINLDTLVDERLSMLLRTMPPNIEIRRQSQGRLEVAADPNEIERVLLNLCLNAREAMGDKGVLTVRTEQRTIEGKDWAVLTVEDTGPGVDRTVIQRIFEPFFTTKAAAGGMGLGLSIVQSIALAHDGRVEVENLPEGGARFCVFLPIVQPGEMPVSEPVGV